MSAAAEREPRDVRDFLTAAGLSDNWLTPPDILDALGLFDLDPCAAPEPRPWPTATRHITRPDDGLYAPWQGRVWLNPPYSNTPAWMGRLAAYGAGTALIFARVETGWFADYVWARASALLFLQGRVRFIRPGSVRPIAHNAPAPSVLVAYGMDDAERLASCGIPGAYVDRWRPAVAFDDGKMELFGEAL